MRNIFRYIIYIASTTFVSHMSTLAPEDKDYLYGMSKNLITICITLFALYTTISNFVMIQLSKFRKESKGEIEECVLSLRRNVYILLALIFANTCFFVVLLNCNFPIRIWQYFLQNQRFFTDGVVFFTLFYFLYVIYDSTLAFYNLFQHNNK